MPDNVECPTDSNVETTTGRTPTVWGAIPPRNPNFTGRDEALTELAARLATDTTVVLPSILHGLGGIGKTQVASEYIYRHSHHYDLIWWIDATHATQIRASLTELARALRLSGSSDANAAVPAVLQALRTGQPYHRWLLVFDAADTPETVLPFIPHNGPGDILITSRNSNWAGIARPLELTTFTRAESVKLLGRRANIDLNDADELAEKLGDLPLAVGQAAAWHAVTGMPVREYLRLFDDSIEELIDSSAGAEYEVSVAAAWNVSFEALKTRNPAAHQILQICAFFGTEPIPRAFFTEVSTVSISPEIDPVLRDPIELARSIGDINRYGLARIDHRKNTIQLHRLVQLVLRNQMMTPEVRAQMRRGAHQLLAAFDPQDPESGRAWPRYQELLPHAYAANLPDSDDTQVWQLYLNLARYLFEVRDHQEAARFGQQFQKRLTETLGATHPHTLKASALLGFCLWTIGRYHEAAELNQQTLKLNSQAADEDETALAIQRNLTLDLRAQGDFNAATKLTEKAYHKAKSVFGENSPETLEAAFQHAISLRLSGNYTAAAQLDQDTYQRRTEVLGHDHPQTFSVHAGINVDLREAGEYHRSRVGLQQAMQNFVTIYGEDFVESALYLSNNSITRRRDGDYDGALPLSRQGLQQLRLIYGDDHATTLFGALAHSIDLRYSGDLAEAKKLGVQTVERYQNSLGEHHPHTQAAAIDLALTLRAGGDPAGARVINQRALERFDATIGPDHPYSIVATINLASDFAAINETEKAIELGKTALNNGRRVLGEHHPTVLAAAANLDLDLANAGRTDEANPDRDSILVQFFHTLGNTHPLSQAAVNRNRIDCDIDPMLM